MAAVMAAASEASKSDAEIIADAIKTLGLLAFVGFFLWLVLR